MTDANGNDIKVGSKVYSICVEAWRKMIEHDIYIVARMSESGGKHMYIKSESTGKEYYVYPRDCVVIPDDPKEFIESLPV